MRGTGETQRTVCMAHTHTYTQSDFLSGSAYLLHAQRHTYPVLLHQHVGSQSAAQVPLYRSPAIFSLSQGECAPSGTSTPPSTLQPQRLPPSCFCLAFLHLLGNCFCSPFFFRFVPPLMLQPFVFVAPPFTVWGTPEN